MQKQSSENNTLSRIIYITLIIFSIGILVGVVSYTSYKLNETNNNQKIIAIRTVNASVNIIQYGAGLNGDKDSLKFGKVPFGGGSTRYLDINTSEDALVRIEVTGDITQFLSVDKNNFILPKNTAERLTFQLEVPNEGIEVGSYNGKIKVIFLKP